MRKVRINGERASIPVNWEELMQQILQLISSENIPISRIYNWDETALFYRQMPKSTLAKKEMMTLT